MCIVIAFDGVAVAGVGILCGVGGVVGAGM